MTTSSTTNLPPVTRIVYTLARSADLSDRQAHALGKAVQTLKQLRTTTPDAIVAATRISQAKAERLIEAARLLHPKDVPPDLAVKLVDLGITRSLLAEGTLADILVKLQSLPAISRNQLAAWSVRAAAAIRRESREPSQPELPSLSPPQLLNPVPVRKLILVKDTTWQRVATDLYGLQGNAASELASRLARANRSQPEATLTAGTLIQLLDTPTSPNLPDPQQAMVTLRAFAPYLSEADASHLVEAGVTAPNVLLLLDRKSHGPDLSISESLLHQLNTQAILAALPGMAPELAYFYAAVRPRSLKTLFRTSPLEIAKEIIEAKALGYLPEAIDHTPESIRGWMSILADTFTSPDFDLADAFLLEVTLCGPEILPTCHLENYYIYRVSPTGCTAANLEVEIQNRQQWLTEAANLGLGSPSEAIAASVNQALLLCHSKLEEFSLMADPASIATLQMFIDFMVENTLPILELLKTLTEGHEAFRHREYDLALSAYERAETWFNTKPELYWSNKEDADGSFKPSFALDPDPDASIVNYYNNRHNAGDVTTLLDTLHIDLEEYYKRPLEDRGIYVGLPGPFSQVLYYIHNFLLPMCQADCYAQLGQYCRALDYYFRVYQEEIFTETLDDTNEREIVTAVAGSDSPRTQFPRLTLFNVTTPPGLQYYPEYLNEVEKWLVRLQVAETLLHWGDSCFRRTQVSEAEACYAQVLRIFYLQWNSLQTLPYTNFKNYCAEFERQGFNPRAAELTTLAQQQLLKLARGFNFLGYPEDYVPAGTYHSLLASARYLGERARQLGRDALQFLNLAEQEQGNQRSLMQTSAITQSQLAIESRRVEEAAASIRVVRASADLATQNQLNNITRRQELDTFSEIRLAQGISGSTISGFSSGAGFGSTIGGSSIGPALGTLTGGIGLAYGHSSGYVSGVLEIYSLRNELVRQRLELEKAKAVANAEITRTQNIESIARLSQAAAALNAIFAESNLAYAQTKRLNAEFWYQTSLRLENLASAYLNQAIGMAFLAEQAFEFTEGRRLDVIRFDYSQSEGVLSADALLADLDSIEYERISGQQKKVTPIKRIIRLRQQDFLGFAELKRTGQMTFQTTLFDFDLYQPGTYQQHIAKVEVEVQALIPLEGIRGTLRKSGLSYLRYPLGTADTTAAPSNTAPDWIEHTPTNYRIAPVFQPDEALVLSPFDIRRDSVVLRPDPGEQLQLFEGSGVGTTWMLSLQPCGADFDLATLTDVNLIIYYYAQFDAQLERTINLERRKLLALGDMVMQRSRGFSLREMFPDAMYHLQNPAWNAPEDPWQERTLHLEISPKLFPPNQRNRRLRGITLAFVGNDDYVNVQARLSKDRFRLTPTDFQAGGGDLRVKAALGQDQPPEGTWQLTLSAADNSDLALRGHYQVDRRGRVALDRTGHPISDTAGVSAFDPEKLSQIKDIWLLFNYQYDLAGECGEPIVFWTHFYDAETPHYVAHRGVHSTDWLTDVLRGSNSWSWSEPRRRMRSKALRSDSASICYPIAELDLQDVSVTGQLYLPPDAGHAAGLVFRYQPPGGGHRRGGFYLAQLIRVADDKLEVRLSARSGRGASGGSAPLITDPDTTVLNLQADLSTLAPLTDFTLTIRGQGRRVEVYVNRRLVLIEKPPESLAVPPTLPPASGSIGLYAQGGGIEFSELIVSDLTDLLRS